jgi:uncharacterized protein (DUF1501 family)
MISPSALLNDNTALVSLGAAVPGVFARGVAAANNEGSARGKTLVVVQLAGGVDGLNTVVPYSNPAYRQNRPNLALPNERLHVIDEQSAFHPAMGKVAELMKLGKLAIVQGVGYPSPSFSHFRAMDIWQGADPEGTFRDGWMGRYFDTLTDLQGHPLSGVAVGGTLPKAFSAKKASVPAIENAQTFGLQPAYQAADPARRTASLLKLYDVYKPANTPFAALLDTTLDSADQASNQLKSASANYRPAVQYPQSALATGLRLLAELIDSGTAENRLRVGQVTLTGWDTHTQQPGRIDQLLTQLSDALSAFWSDLVGHGHENDVLIMTWSEFGRRVRENANAGTDHGSAAPLFVLGGQVKGGFYGDPVSLTNLDDGNLRFTTDFRSVYATVLEKWLGASSADVLGKKYDTLGFVA